MRGDFLDIVERVDASVGFLREYRRYKEAEMYLSCFAVSGSSDDVDSHVLHREFACFNRRREQALGREAVTHHLLYTRFRSVAGPLPPLLGELE
ncbi:unnamed protein product [Peniophora sp. CBMAI 1063]|nr:unnamed protein product [Peniophora sp. CBMAI 1063]